MILLVYAQRSPEPLGEPHPPALSTVFLHSRLMGAPWVLYCWSFCIAGLVSTCYHQYTYYQMCQTSKVFLVGTLPYVLCCLVTKSYLNSLTSLYLVACLFEIIYAYVLFIYFYSI